MNGLVSLGSLRLQAQQQADLENNPSVSTSEWNNYLRNSYKELYDMLVAAYGNDYEVALPYQFVPTSNVAQLPDGSVTYLLPNGSAAPAFYKLLGVDLQCSSSPTGWVTLERFEFIERNKFGSQNGASMLRPRVKYRLTGTQIQFSCIPQAPIQIWYVPLPTNLQSNLICALTAGSATVTLADTSSLSVGMSVYAPTGIQSNTTISVINSSTQVTLSAIATASIPVATVQCWTDATMIDGLSGWEEYVIVDAAIKASSKGENDINNLLLRRKELKERIEGMAEGRDAGQAHHVSDVLSTQGGYDGFGDGFGGGF